jgi:hypothetical protein
MRLLDQLQQLRRANRLAQLCRQVVGRSYAPVREAAETSAAKMPLAEARGYIRAKATPVLRADIKIVLQSEPDLGAWAREVLLEHASRHIVESVLKDVRRVATPPVVRRRAA